MTNPAVKAYLDKLEKENPAMLVALRQEVERDRCKQDLFFLITEVLGYKDLCPILHKPLCREVEKINPLILGVSDGMVGVSDTLRRDSRRGDRLVLPDGVVGGEEGVGERGGVSKKQSFGWARGHFKTTIISIGHSIQLILLDPDMTILLSMNTLDMAIGKLKEIRGHFMDNEKFRELFPEYCPKPNKVGKIEFGTTEYFNVPNRKQRTSDPTMRVAGIGTTLTGSHPKVHKYDDLVTDQTVGNETQIEASVDWYGYAQNLFYKPTEAYQSYTYTPYHFNDLSARIRKRPDFQHSYVPAIVDEQFLEYFKRIGGDVSKFRIGDPTFPSRFSLKGLESIKNDPEVGTFKYNAQYLLNPIDPEKQEFREEYITYYPTLPDYLYTYILVDPASRKKKTSDYTAWTVMSVDCDDVWYKREQGRLRLDPGERVDLVFRLAGKYQNDRDNLQYVAYETIAFQDTDRYNIEQRMKKPRGIKFRIEEIPATNASKKDRIRGLIPRYKLGLIRWPMAGMDNFKNNEFLTFPVSEHDDMLDSESFMLRLPRLRRPDKIEIVEEKKDTGTLAFMLSPANIDRCMGRAKELNGCMGNAHIGMNRIMQEVMEGRVR